MAEHGPGGPDGDGRFVRLDDGDLYVVEDGPPDAPAVLLIHGTGTTLGLPVLVIFGTADKRWRSSSAAAYRDVPGARVELLPGVGHTPMLEDPHTTGTLLLRFALALKEEKRVGPR